MYNKVYATAVNTSSIINNAVIRIYNYNTRTCYECVNKNENDVIHWLRKQYNKTNYSELNTFDKTIQFV